MEHNNDSINYFKKNLYLAPMIATFPMFSVRISLVVVGGVGEGGGEVGMLWSSHASWG